MHWKWTFLKVKIVKNKNVKSEYTRQNMAFVKKTVLQKEELTEEVRKNPLVHDKSHKLPVKPNWKILYNCDKESQNFLDF